ncbi:MAG: hypothetical protein ACR2LJ_01185 [Acidimicrobiales bacterium]
MGRLLLAAGCGCCTSSRRPGPSGPSRRPPAADYAPCINLDDPIYGVLDDPIYGVLDDDLEAWST